MDESKTQNLSKISMRNCNTNCLKVSDDTNSKKNQQRLNKEKKK